MESFDAHSLKPGDRAYAYVWTGGAEQEPFPFTVVRVNRETVTIAADDSTQRIPIADVIGRWDFD